MPISITALPEQIRPDFTATWTIVEAEKEMPGFKFLGTGWYIKKEATLFIMTGELPDDFYFWVWFGKNPRNVFGEIYLAPIKQNDQQ